MDQIGTSLVRTVSPLCAGALIAWAVRQGVTVDESVRQPLTEVLTLAFSAGWYLGARLLETWVSPRFGWLLGSPRQPSYTAPERPAAPPTVPDMPAAAPPPAGPPAGLSGPPVP